MKIWISLIFGMLLSDGIAQFGTFPITLSIPYDADTITETAPDFVWQCNLSTVQNDPRFSLQYALVKLENEQTAAEAIASNPAICVVNGLLSSTYSYPSTLQELEKGETYVWQVQLLFNDQIVQESEPWKFTIADPKEPKEQFILLRRQADGSKYVITKPRLYIMIPNNKQVSNMNAMVRNSKNETIKVKLLPIESDGNQKGREGNLYYVVKMEENDLKKGDYVFEWRSGSGQVYYLNFKLLTGN